MFADTRGPRSSKPFDMNSWFGKDSVMYAASFVGVTLEKLLSYVSSKIIFGTNDEGFKLFTNCKTSLTCRKL